MTVRRIQKTLLIILSVVLIPTGCREGDGPLAGSSGQLIVLSDPPGASIFVDGVNTGLITPDTVPDIGGAHDISAALEVATGRFAYAARVIIQGSEPLTLNGPLTAHCSLPDPACYNRNRAQYTAGNITLTVNSLGAMLLANGNGGGVFWPAGTNDSYVSNAMPLIAAKVGGRAVSLGMYDVPTMAGRPVPQVTITDNVLRSDQKAWIVPNTTSRTITTIRGIEVREQILIDPSVPDVALIRLTYRNITNSPLYQLLDPRGSEFGQEGLAYEDVYVGFGMDPDIGTVDDDWMSYDPQLNAVFAYDANFNDQRFNSGAATTPGLVGIRMMSVPSGANIILNGYGTQGGLGSASDWNAGEGDEPVGWGVLSGTAPYAPDDADPKIGMLVPGESDVRILVSAGPYALRPAEEITIVVAVALARPVPGTFTTLTNVAPGNPHDPARQIMTIAAALRAKFVAAEALLSKIGN